MEVREARLRREWAELYPGLEPGVWHPAAQLVPLALRHRLQSHAAWDTSRRILMDAHFEFRGGLPRDASWSGILSRLDDG